MAWIGSYLAGGGLARKLLYATANESPLRSQPQVGLIDGVEPDGEGRVPLG